MSRYNKKPKKQAKNYIGFVNDHSGSMSSLRNAAASDYNANIEAIKNAANAEMMDTVVSVVGVGVNSAVERQVVISNPHVLKPVTDWIADGGTPLCHGTCDMIRLLESLPDSNEEHVSFLIIVTTDGQATDERENLRPLQALINEKLKKGNWTFVLRVPKGQAYRVASWGVPSGNIIEWETTAAGMAKSSVQTQAAMQTYYTQRSAGARSSNTFYTSVANVDVSKLTDISKETSLYVVDPTQEGMWIKDFILTKRMEYLIGAAFYQLTKTEARVSPTKLILIRDKNTGAVYAGPDARKMLGLDTVNNARLNPNHGNGNYDIFIQSESVNRKLQAGSGVLYWAKQGRPMTQADLDKYAPKTAPVAPAVPQLVPAPATGRPTPSPIPKTPKPVGDTVNGKLVKFFDKRDEARVYARQYLAGAKGSLGDLSNVGGVDMRSAHPGKPRWFVYL